MPNLINKTVATQLKKARASKGWSLEVTSQHCGVSKAMLGQIERGESSPTIAKLWKIATGFALPLSDFLGNGHEQDLRVQSLAEAEAIRIETIFEYDPATGMEMFDLQLAVGHEQHSEPHQKGVIEHIVVTSGCMQYLLGDEWNTLDIGDKAKFAADQPHGYRNVGDVPLRFFNIIYYPQPLINS
ncbi:XRE family transcriptional regulator [Psychromonas sp.]|nr:XRE family transcriptional regulator [Psychromonas sp.]